jgi:tripartite-type tricarboxylate transporter receptor subunit TctC
MKGQGMIVDHRRANDRHRRLIRSVIGSGAALVALVASLSAAWAQDFPVRPVRIVVPFPAGGTADAVPRRIADYLSRKWKQPVVIENRVGAGGNIGAELVFKTEPDGYTLLSSPPPPLVINHNLYARINFDPTQFAPVVNMVRVPNALIVTPRFAPKSVAEVIAFGRDNPGKINVATQGNGTTSHLTSAMFQMMANVKFQHVPYTGSAPALNDLVAGNVEMMFDNLGVSLGLVQGNKLKLLAVASTQRLAALPDVPTIAATLPGFESAAWYAMVAPPRTPAAIAGKINADVNEVLRLPEMQSHLANWTAEVIGGTPAELAAYMREEVERWNKVIKGAGVRVE